MYMNELASFAQKGSKFAQFDENGKVIGKYIGYKFVPDPFQKELLRVCYKIVMGDGEEKSLETSSKKLAALMAPVEIGEHITITRIGSGFKTEYKVLRLVGVTKKEEENNPTLPENPMP